MVIIVHASRPGLSTKLRSRADDSKSRQPISTDVDDRFPKSGFSAENSARGFRMRNSYRQSNRNVVLSKSALVGYHVLALQKCCLSTSSMEVLRSAVMMSGSGVPRGTDHKCSSDIESWVSIPLSVRVLRDTSLLQCKANRGT